MTSLTQSRSLVFLSVHLREEFRGRLFSVALELIRRLNPHWDILVIDNASPVDPIPYLGAPLSERLFMYRFENALGHWSYDGPSAGNGPGRANMKGIEIALADGYDRIVYQESDALCSLPYDWWFARMTKPVACQPLCRHRFPDWNVWAMQGAFMKEFDFIGKYDWANRKAITVGEQVYADIFGEHLQMIPVRGERWEHDLDAAKFREVYGPMGGCDLLTHVRTETFAAFLEMNGFPDLVERL